MFDGSQFSFYANNFNQVVTHSAALYQPPQFFSPIISGSNEFPYSFSPSNFLLPQINMPINNTASIPTVSPSNLNTISKNKDDELSDSDISCDEEEENLTNPYTKLIKSKVSKERPSNWRSLVLFNGRINADDLSKDCSRPQCDDGSILPQIRPIINSLFEPDGTLRNSNSPLTMQISSKNATNETPSENRGYISANGLVWSKRKPETPIKTKTTPTFPVQPIVRKRFANQSLVIAGGKRIRTDNSNECIAFAQSAKCTAGYLCTFDHNGKSEHTKQQLCENQMLGTCRKDVNCSESHHGLAKHQIPVCQYFLNMTCVNEHCPYLHIKHNDKLENCGAFQRGTCLLGLKCTKPHRYNSRVIALKCSRTTRSVSPVERHSTNEVASSPINLNQELPSWNF